jgi:hypothetical protein
LFRVNKTDERKKDGLPGGCFDDGGFSNPCGIQVDVGPFFLRFSCWVEIEELNDIANEVW